MWIFSIYGFFSVACYRRRDGSIDPGTVMVRARSIRHLRQLMKRFPVLATRKVHRWQGRDYQYRILVDKKVWAGVVGELATEQTWSNFKDAATGYAQGGDQNYIDTLHRVWSTVDETIAGRKWWLDYKAGGRYGFDQVVGRSGHGFEEDDPGDELLFRDDTVTCGNDERPALLRSTGRHKGRRADSSWQVEQYIKQLEDDYEDG